MSKARPARAVPTPSPAAAALRSYCQETGTSMRALSLAIGRGEKYIADICGGHSRHPDVEGLRALAQHTGLPLTSLTGGDETGCADVTEELAGTVRAGLFMTDVLAAVRDDDALTPGGRDKRIRNIKVFCFGWLKRDPSAVPADARWLSNYILEKGWGPAALGVSEKRWNDVLSSVRRGLETARAIPRQNKPITAVGAEWRGLYDKIDESWLATSLSPFIRYCDALGLQPSDVTDATIGAYTEFREAYDLSTSPTSRKIAKLRTAWNRAAATVDGWPSVIITLGARQRLNLPWTAFPDSFRESWIAYETSRGVPGYANHNQMTLLERARARQPEHQTVLDGKMRLGDITPLEDSTLRAQEGTVRFLASAAVRTGLVTADELSNIGDIAAPELVAHVIHEDVQPRLGLATGYADNLVKHAASIARRWVPEITADELLIFRALRAELATEREDSDGLSDRDRRRLAPFLGDVDTMARLVSLPAWIIERNEAKRERDGIVTRDMARDVQAAVAMLIEQTLPVRWGDLTRTLLDTNIMLPAKPGGTGMLYYRISKTRKKGRRKQQAHLSAWKCELIRTFILIYHPVLAANDPLNRHLFPGQISGEPTTRLGDDVRARVYAWLGYTVNPHLWRKLMGGYLLLQTNDMEKVADLLGHVEGSRATRVYVEMKSAWAAQELDAHVTRLTEATRMPDDIRRRLAQL
ncbi:site-specific integrase [Rhodovibrio sodomensis]|nr:site-specific integrase [Rhodovibrio sodomensis]